MEGGGKASPGACPVQWPQEDATAPPQGQATPSCLLLCCWRGEGAELYRCPSRGLVVVRSEAWESHSCMGVLRDFLMSTWPGQVGGTQVLHL